MAFTEEDYNKIWASNSPLPEYTFSDDDYLEGWNFVGELPPSRTMWDAFKKDTDLKMKDLYGANKEWCERAETASANAENSAELAEDWATKTDGMVDGNEYSAKKYAQDASTSASSASASATSALNSASSASTTATQLMAYLEDKEELTAPAVDPTLTFSGAAAEAKVTGNWLRNISDYTDINSFFYAKDKIKGNDGSLVTSVGSDLYRIPLNNGNVIKISSTGNNSIWGTSLGGYIAGIEFTDDTYMRITETPRVVCGAIDIAGNSIVAYGNANTRYLYVSLTPNYINDVKVNKNYAFADPQYQFLKVTDLDVKVDEKIGIKSYAWIDPSNNTVVLLSSPYYTYSMCVKTGDKFIFNERVGAASANAVFVDLLGAITSISYTTLEYTVPSDGIILIMGSNDVAEPNATYYPVDSPTKNLVTTQELINTLADYPEKSNTVLKRGYGQLNSNNLITDPHISDITRWRLNDTGTGASWEIINGDEFSNILHINTGNNNVGLAPYLSANTISSLLVAFKMKGEANKNCVVQIIASGVNSNNETVALANLYLYAWDRTDIDWKEMKVYIPLSEPMKNIAVAIYASSANYEYKFKEVYIGEETKYFPFLVDNGLDYNGIGDSVLKTLPMCDDTIVSFGDSLTDNGFEYGDDIATTIQNITGANVINFGFGGTQMSQHHTDYYDPFCMYRLAYAIANNDWTLQDNALSLSPIPANAARKIAYIKTVDFNDVNTITIEYGTNDWANGQAIDNPNNKYDTDTIGGALRYSIEALLTAFPHLRITVVSIAWRCVVSGSTVVSDSDTNVNSQGNTVPQINSKLKEIADEYHLQYVDVYNNTSFNKFTFFANFNDQIHPGAAGRKKLGEIIAKSLT